MFDQMMEIVVRIATSQLVEAVIKRAIDAAQLLPLRPVTAHYRSVQRRFTNMPFIYRDLKLDVLGDFVTVDRATLDNDSLKKAQQQRYDIGTDERIKRRGRLLFLGDAGMGKTTLIRHTILTLIANNGISPLLEEREHLLPFYVPLKALDNTKDHPIVRYLLDNHPILSGHRGPDRLLRLARERKVFLLLDGYDEVPDPTGQTVRETPFFKELQTIYDNQRRPTYSPPKGGDYGPLYEALGECRIWLSSRFEFYRDHRVALFEGTATSGAAVIGLTGMGGSRPQLVRNIFDRYRQTNNKYEELLNEELFLAQIDASDEDELRKLSFNPLFLTIMCFIYVTEVIDPIGPARTWANSVSLLINQCVKLLVRDLDDDKARELPPRQREGMRLRRGRYKEEMEAFLPYFASELMANGQSVFDIVFIRQKLRQYFADSALPNAGLILRSLDSGTPSSDLARQLIWCGIFITVETEPVATYDFPHLRFREVLATKYFEDHPDRNDLLGRYVDSNKFDLIYLLYVTSEYRAEVLKYILSRTCNVTDARFGRLALDCIARRPKDKSFRPTLETFLSDCLKVGRRICWPRDLLLALPSDSMVLAGVKSHLDEAVTANDRDVIELCLAITDILDSGTHVTLRRLIQHYRSLGSGRIVVLRSAVLMNCLAKEHATALMGDHATALELISIIASNVTPMGVAISASEVAIPAMSPFQFACLCAHVASRRSLITAIKALDGLPVEKKAIALLVDYYLAHGGGRLASEFYVVVDALTRPEPSPRGSGLNRAEIFLSEFDMLAGRSDHEAGRSRQQSPESVTFGPTTCALVWDAINTDLIGIENPPTFFVSQK